MLNLSGRLRERRCGEREREDESISEVCRAAEIDPGIAFRRARKRANQAYCGTDRLLWVCAHVCRGGNVCVCVFCLASTQTGRGFGSYLTHTHTHNIAVPSSMSLHTS